MLTVGLTAYGTNYYVKNGGNDAAAGTSDALAWQTLWKVNNYSSTTGFLPGDSIFFKRGETVSNAGRYALIIRNNGTATNPIYVGAYGTGASPILDPGKTVISGSDVEGNWTNTSGNIWTLSSTIGARNRIWLDGTEIQEAYSPATLNGTYRWHWTGNVFYLYSVGNPATTYSTIAYVSVSQGIDFDDVSYIVVSDLDLRNYRTGIGLTGCNGITIQNDSIGWDVVYYGIAMYKSATNPCDSITIINNTFNTNDHFFDTQFNGENSEDAVYVTNDCHYVTVSYNTFINWGHAAFCVYDRDQTEPISYFKVHHNYFKWGNVDYGRAFGIDIEEATAGSVGNEIYNNYVYNQAISSQIQATGLKVYHNIWNGTRGRNYTAAPNYPASDAVSIVSYNGLPSDMEFDHNVFANSEGCGVLIRSSSPPVIQNNKFRNNIFYNNKGQYWGDQTTGYQYYQLYIQDSPTAVLDNTYENNLFYYPGVDDLIYYGRDATNDYPHTVAEFNAENGNADDVMSGNIAGDPVFMGPSDFRLYGSSPAIDAGIDVGLIRDYAGNVIPFNGIPDIGAYEYGSYEIIPGVTQLGTGTGNNLMVDKNGKLMIIQ